MYTGGGPDHGDLPLPAGVDYENACTAARERRWRPRRLCAPAQRSPPSPTCPTPSEYLPRASPAGTSFPLPPRPAAAGPPPPGARRRTGRPRPPPTAARRRAAFTWSDTDVDRGLWGGGGGGRLPGGGGGGGGEGSALYSSPMSMGGRGDQTETIFLTFEPPLRVSALPRASITRVTSCLSSSGSLSPLSPTACAHQPTTLAPPWPYTLLPPSQKKSPPPRSLLYPTAPTLQRAEWPRVRLQWAGWRCAERR